MVFCEEKKIHLISDEVYGLSNYDDGAEHGTAFVSVLSINTHGIIDESRLHILYGMSKVRIRETNFSAGEQHRS